MFCNKCGGKFSVVDRKKIGITSIIFACVMIVPSIIGGLFGFRVPYFFRLDVLSFVVFGGIGIWGLKHKKRYKLTCKVCKDVTESNAITL